MFLSSRTRHFSITESRPGASLVRRVRRGCLCVNDGIARLEIVWPSSVPIQFVVGLRVLWVAQMSAQLALAAKSPLDKFARDTVPAGAVRAVERAPKRRFLEKGVDNAHLVT